MTFFTAPPSSQPITSSLVYGRKYGVAIACCTSVARSTSVQATTVAAGCSAAISGARLGPVTTATRSGVDPGGLDDDLAHPLGGAELDALHQRDQGGVGGAGAPAQSARLPRSVCDGTASTTRSAPSSASAGVGGGGDPRRAAARPGR